jgi:hypothetical protein
MLPVFLLACGVPSWKETAPPPAASPGKPDPAPGSTATRLFTDVTEEAGIRFTHFNDASPRKYLPETMGAGVAFFDYDGDGRPDLYLVNGCPLTGDRGRARSGSLYRNLDGRRFQDVTREANLTQPMYGMGAAVGDIDNDGHLDLFVTGVGGDRLYRNRGDRTFEDATQRMSPSHPGFGSSAAFLDYDLDGFLDLFVGRYVEWSPEHDVRCSPDGTHRTYCTPEVYPGESNRLYRNLAGKGFRDVTQEARVRLPEGKTLGVVAVDHNRDGWPDLAVANDTVRNFLFINNRDGTFSEAGVAVGMAYSESGNTRGGMGIDAEDADGDGAADIVIGNFSQEMAAFYRSTSGGFYVDDAAQVGIGLPTLLTLAFGTLLADFSGDGRMDLLIVNGHIEPEISRTRRVQSYAQPIQFFRNAGNGKFALAADGEGSPLSTPLVGRGLAAADIDGDGDLDLAVTQNGRRAVLLRNEAEPQSWIRVRLVGRASNRTGYGGVVRAFAGERSWTRSLVSGRSYLSACEPVLTLGLGDAESLDRLEILWPSGRKQTVPHPRVRTLLTVEERLQ